MKSSTIISVLDLRIKEMKSLVQSHTMGLEMQVSFLTTDPGHFLPCVLLCSVGFPVTFLISLRSQKVCQVSHLSLSHVASAFPKMSSIECFIIWVTPKIFHGKKKKREIYDQIYLEILHNIYIILIRILKAMRSPAEILQVC